MLRTSESWFVKVAAFMAEVVEAHKSGAHVRPLWLMAPSGYGKTCAVELAALKAGVRRIDLLQEDDIAYKDAFLRMMSVASAIHAAPSVAIIDDADAFFDNELTTRIPKSEEGEQRSAAAPTSEAKSSLHKLVDALFRCRTPIILISTDELGKSSVLMSLRKSDAVQIVRPYGVPKPSVLLPIVNMHCRGSIDDRATVELIRAANGNLWHAIDNVRSKRAGESFSTTIFSAADALLGLSTYRGQFGEATARMGGVVPAMAPALEQYAFRHGAATLESIEHCAQLADAFAVYDGLRPVVSDETIVEATTRTLRLAQLAEDYAAVPGRVSYAGPRDGAMAFKETMDRRRKHAKATHTARMMGIAPKLYKHHGRILPPLPRKSRLRPDYELLGFAGRMVEKPVAGLLNDKNISAMLTERAVCAHTSEGKFCVDKEPALE